MKLRAISALTVAVLGMVLFAPLATADAYPPTTCASLSVSTTQPAAGETITVSGVNFTANTSVHLVLNTTTTDLATVSSDAQGSFSTPVKLPAGLTGAHAVVAVSGAPTGHGCGRPHVVVDIQPFGSSTPTGAHHGGNSFTGVDLLLVVLVAAVLIAAGVALTRGAKRGRASTGQR